MPEAITSTRPRTENGVFYPALDGLRAIAFLMVFAQHYLQMPWGWSGVDLFFVLSGFLITGILFDTRFDPHRARNFYVRRTLRIFPLYYGIMLALVLLYPLAHWEWSWRWLAWPAYLGNFARFVHPYLPESATQRWADFEPVVAHTHFHLFLGHFWSLCIEEQFYLVWPWLVFFIPDRRRLMYICGAIVVLCPLLRVYADNTLPQWMLDNEVLYRATPFRLDALLLGGLIALALRGPGSQVLLRVAKIGLAIAVAAIAVWAILTPAHHIFWRPYPYPEWKFTWGLSAIDLVAALIILVALQPRSLVYRLLDLQPLRWLGRISYGAYVFHDIPHRLYDDIAHRALGIHARIAGELATAVVALIGTLILSWLSYRFLESPFLALKERWTIRSPRPSADRIEAKAAEAEGPSPVVTLRES